MKGSGPFRLLTLPIMILAGLLCLQVEAQPPSCTGPDSVTFVPMDQGGYLYLFTPTPSSGSTILSTGWAFLGEDLNQFGSAQQPQVTFPSEGDYLVCLSAVLLNDQQTTCTAVHCELVDVPIDPACATLQPAFTINPQGGGVIEFIDQTISDEPLLSEIWDFGDGTTSAMNVPTHAFPGAGPYQVCLVVSTTNCTASACNWIYLGPPDVSCDALLQPAIGVVQYERTIAVFDQSITSGMNSSIHWDFGDGGAAVGSPVMHTYPEDGYYALCGTVDLWGPLTSDTCSATVCQNISTIQAASAISTSTPRQVLCAHPVPFTDELTIEGASPSAHWELFDLLGRVHSSGVVPITGPLTIRDPGMKAGPYFVRIRSKTSTRVLRVAKD